MKSALKSGTIKRIALGIMGDTTPDRREATRDNEVWDKFEILKEALGADDLLTEIVLSMSTEEGNDTFDFIGHNHDISLTPRF